MADIFLSYSREDRATAEQLAATLEASGYSVWWDRNLPGGARYLEVTEAELTAAKAVVVVWTRTSITSHWVADEAGAGRDTGRLAPISTDGSMPPLGFRQFQVMDFTRWSGTPDEPAFAELLATLGRLAEPRSTARLPHAAANQDGLTIAVLPFVNMSSDPEQEHFSDGLTEELIGQLAQNRRLRVAGRTSSFAFKGKGGDLRTIGDRLGVNHVLEGSVRRAGQQLRISAQLIKCADGYNLWSQTYDRTLDDVFEIQESVARAVAEALGAKLTANAHNADYGGTRSFEAFEHFLRGRFPPGTLLDPAKFNARAEQLRRAVAIDPGYAKAWAHLANLAAYVQSGLHAEDAARLDPERDKAAANAMALAPDLPVANTALGWLHADKRNWLAAEPAWLRGVVSGQLHDFEAEGIVGAYLTNTGRAYEGLALRERARDSDPLSLGWSNHVQGSYLTLEMWDRFDAEYRRSLDLEGARGAIEFGRLMRLIATGETQDEINAQFDRIVALADGNAIMAMISDVRDSPPDALKRLREHSAKTPRQLFWVAELAAAYGDSTLALDCLTAAAPHLRLVMIQRIWHPAFRAARQDPRFKEMVRGLGLAQFWRTTGKWGDFARPIGSGDFEIVR